METNTLSSNTLEQGATVVITHLVKEDVQASYDAWLNEIGAQCKASTGYLDRQIIHPISGLTTTYTIVIRFDTIEHLHSWMNSSSRKDLIEKVRPFLVKDDDFFIRSGLDFWFTPQGAKAKVPIRWKQFLVTWSAIFPLALLMPLIVIPLLRLLHIPQNHYTDTLFVTCSIVFSMVYIVMPRYTKMIHRWLFK